MLVNDIERERAAPGVFLGSWFIFYTQLLRVIPALTLKVFHEINPRQLDVSPALATAVMKEYMHLITIL